MSRRVLIVLILSLLSFISKAQCGTGAIVISEVYLDSRYNEDNGRRYHHFGEYIELYNSSNVPVDMSGWIIKDNHTQFTFPFNVVIAPGGFKLIVFGKTTNATSAINKFIELFPEAAGHSSDILVQQEIQLFNEADKVSLYNDHNILIDQVAYISTHGLTPIKKQSALSYMGISRFNIEISQKNNSGGVFNGAIDAESKMGIHISNVNHYFETLGAKSYAEGMVTPFSIPFQINLDEPGALIFTRPPMHYIHTTSYDVKNFNIKTAESRTYFTDSSKPIISLSYDARTSKVWGTETQYDALGRQLKTSYPALTCAGFNNIPFLSEGYFYDSMVKWYYGNDNTLEPYQATAEYPYSEFIYDNLTPGNVINVIGGNKVSGEWKTGFSYTVPAAQEMYYLYGRDYFDGPESGNAEEVITKFYKTVSIDANGTENVVFTDSEGKTLAAARTGGSMSYPVLSLIGSQGHIDIHIPVGISSSDITLLGNASDYIIYNLRTGQQVVGPLSGGNVYRISIQDFTPPPNNFVSILTTGAIHPSNYNECRGIQYKVNYYDYALNIYNSTGQLSKTIQPNAIAATASATFSGVQPVPAHMTATGFVSTFNYNSLGQVVTATSPDEGTSKFLYRKDGKIRYSQNSFQASQSSPKISYTEYDSYGRPVESGVLATVIAWSSLNPDAALASGTRSEQVFTIYDYSTNYPSGQTAPPSLSSVLSAAGILSANYSQKNLSGNVAITYTAVGSTITAATWYSYDIYGRVEWIVQLMSGMPAKTIHYYYDYKGNVSKVIYQKDKYNANTSINEMFVHRYTYDQNTLSRVETSTNNLSFTVHADYSYYLTGELKRKSYAGGVQGVDYVYTLGGQLKSINHPSLQQTKDPGHDSNDLFGLSLDYYSGDYIRAGTDIAASTVSSPLDIVYTDQFNGNIKATRFANRSPSMDFVNGLIQQKAYVYRYNRNNWLQDAAFGSVTGNTINPDTRYAERNITYDSNGNIMSLRRTNETGATYDNLNYTYNPGKNQLNRVDDTMGVTASITYDIEPQAANNYVYNLIGQLTQNVSENLFYFYNAAGLVTEVRKGTNPVVKFYYNDRGHRVRKESFSTASPYSITSTDYYVLDAAGNTMAVYTMPTGGSIALKENPVYGGDRLGVFYRADATTNYELKDHLGNVRAVFKKVSLSPVMQSYADYYPFGEQLPARNSMSNYRYAFQGQEFDRETGMEAFQLRLWDGRIGRWLSPDPYGQYHSPYLGMGNNPISGIDSDGGFWQELGNWLSGNGWNSNQALSAQGNGWELGPWVGNLFTGFRQASRSFNVNDPSAPQGQGIEITAFKAVNDYSIGEINFDLPIFALPDIGFPSIKNGWTIWGKDKSGSDRGLKGTTKDSWLSDDFIAPGGGGANLRGLSGMGYRARMVTQRADIAAGVRSGTGFYQQVDAVGSEITRTHWNSIDYELNNNTIHVNDSTITVETEIIHLNGHPLELRRKIDSLNNINKSRASTDEAYRRSWNTKN